jgi:hypothetical protein
MPLLSDFIQLFIRHTLVRNTNEIILHLNSKKLTNETNSFTFDACFCFDGL